MRAYIYLYGSLLIFLVWLVFYALRKDLRRQLWVMSLLTAPLGLSELFFVPEYWRPLTVFKTPISLEDFLFSFVVGGVGAVAYEVFFARRIAVIERGVGYYRQRSLVFLGPLSLLVLWFFAGWRFMPSVLVGMLVTLLLMLVLRRDLFWPAIFAGGFLALLHLLVLLILRHFFPLMLLQWNVTNLQGVLLAGIPIEEVLWAFLTGANVAVFYEFWRPAELARI
jgi:hypothetical protein